ncbi:MULTISPECIES: sigma-70 family RNA polymerase sigma factor [Alcanivorax]|uniref:sigma-70 family RNA polymerase sigma factor n=1 Tax=Alcanivorax TaxID=59753 RepID=UPI00105CD96E|nr:MULTISPECIES: sigma-70 family RNA polymerase sigma factor [Alcanivorax]
MDGDTSEQAGFSKLYQEHHAWLVRWLLKRTRGADNAQDLAHDTFMRLLDRPMLPNGIRNARAWLAKTAGNLAVDQARRQILERNYLALLTALPEQEQPSPEDQWELLQLLERIDTLLDGLRPIEKKTFLMSRLDGLPYRKIAEQLGISLSSVEKYMAKAMLKCYIAAYGERPAL